MADRVGQHLGNYRLLRLLGQGGFADVYLGEHLHLNTRAAIKVLHTHLTSQDIELFRTEQRFEIGTDSREHRGHRFALSSPHETNYSARPAANSSLGEPFRKHLFAAGGAG